MKISPRWRNWSREDRQITIRQLVHDASVSSGTIETILHQHLGLNRVNRKSKLLRMLKFEVLLVLNQLIALARFVTMPSVRTEKFYLYTYYPEKLHKQTNDIINKLACSRKMGNFPEYSRGPDRLPPPPCLLILDYIPPPRLFQSPPFI